MRNKKILIFVISIIGFISLSIGRDWIRAEIYFPEDVSDAIIADLNEDGLIDILILSGRDIHIYIQTKNGFDKAPNDRIHFRKLGEIIDIGEVNPKHPGIEILGLSEKGVKYFYLEDNHYKENSDFLISQRMEKSFYNWGPILSDFAFDINKDGLDEIILFHDSRFYLYYLDDSGAISEAKIDISHKLKNISLNSRPWPGQGFLNDNSKVGYKFRPEISSKNIVFFQDFNMDEVLDVISEKTIRYISLKKSSLAFEENRHEVMKIPVIEENEQEIFLDINGDGRLDKILIELIDPFSKDFSFFPYAKYYVFINGNYAFKSKPDYFFKTIITDKNSPFIDIDNDGDLDFISVWSDISFGSKENMLQILTEYNLKFTLRCYRFLNREGFSKIPDLSITSKVRYKSLSEVGDYPPFNFSDDFNLDGNKDLIIRKNPDNILVYLIDFKQEKLKFEKVILLKIPKDVIRFRLIDLNNDKKCDVFLVAENEIILLLSE